MSRVLILLRGLGRSILKGRTSYGDSVEDEWLIVYLLRELSKDFPETWIRIVDSDGEFLLIEAANVLPRWLNPEVADNRVSAAGILYVQSNFALTSTRYGSTRGNY